MEFLSYLVTFLLLATTALASPQPDQSPILSSEDLKVPGDNPLNYCEDPADNILTIDHADLIPNDVKPGANITAEIYGDLKTDIKNGSQVLFSVAIKVGTGKIPVLSETADLCEFVEGGCPIEKGEAVLQRNITIPEEVPKATYIVKFDALDQEGERITCVEATVKF